jgi:2-oxoglutarate dehydrogenase E2 component (dihydrolipoamide succinyltransferase)
MARIDVIMPQMGESIAEGTLSKWLKQVGDAIKRDEPIFEISTDKVDAEIPAPSAGVLAEILVQQGETVAVNTVVARLETDAGATSGAPAPTPGGAGSPSGPARFLPDAASRPQRRRRRRAAESPSHRARTHRHPRPDREMTDPIHAGA